MKRLTAAVLTVGLLVAPAVAAEPADGPAGPTPGIRASIAHVVRETSLAPSPTAHPNGGSAQKARAALALGFIGALGGAWLGAKIDSNCRCDDPGLMGAAIGLPVGAVLGGIIGWRMALTGAGAGASPARGRVLRQ